MNLRSQVGPREGVDYTLPAPHRKRFANLLIDLCVNVVLIVAIAAAVPSSIGEHRGSGWIALFVAFPLYYIVCELLWQKTLGKKLTKTKVVDRDGAKPAVWQVLIRTLVRCIPIEVFSFSVSRNPVGWHDSLSKTFVVPATFTPEDVRKIDTKHAQKGYTLFIVGLCILLPFMVFGTFMALLLTYAGPERDKNQDEKITAGIANMRSQSETYRTDKNGSYLGFCENEQIHYYFREATTFAGEKETIYTCSDTAEAWASSAPLVLGGFACADSTGDTHKVGRSLQRGETVCPKE